MQSKFAICNNIIGKLHYAIEYCKMPFVARLYNYYVKFFALH